MKPPRFLLPLLASGAIAAADWNQFRGPGGSGVAGAGAQPPLDPSTENLAWKTAVPIGHSSPVVAGQRVFLTGVDDGRLVTLCFDRNKGEPLWQRKAPEVEFEKVHETSSPAASTPLVDAGRVYVYFGSFGLLCYDLDGNELWQRAIPTPKSLYGMSTSPISYGDTLILVLDDHNDLPDSKLSASKVVAFEKATGEVRWETARPLVRSGWSTPTIWKHDGGDELVVLGAGRADSYDPKTGEEKWFATGFSRETIAVPITGDGRVYLAAAQLGGGSDKKIDPAPFWSALLQFDANNDGKVARDEMTEHFTYPLRPEFPLGHAGYGIPLPKDKAKRRVRQQGIFGWVDKNKDDFWTESEWSEHLATKKFRPILMAVKPGGTGNIEDTHVVWELNKSVPEVPSPLFYDGRIYMVRNGGLLAAVDAKEGEQIYRERTSGQGQYSASLVVADAHLYAVSERGQISVVKTGAEFDEVHTHDLDEAVFVTPAIDADTLYLRSERHLWAFRRAAEGR